MISSRKYMLSFLLMSLSVFSLRADEPYVVFEQSGSLAPKQPQACVSPDGVVHLTFGVGDEVFYSAMKYGAVAAPKAAFKVPNLSLGMRRGPRLAVGKQSIVITAIGGQQGKGRDGDVLAYRSQDDGKSWSEAIRVNDFDASAREGLHAMTSGADGRLWCVWLDLRDKGTQLFAASSTDDGKTWSKNMLVYRSTDSSVCECCHPSIISDGEEVHVLFRNSLAGNRDMYLVSSSDGGLSFGTAKRLGSEHWNLNACPMDGGMVTKSAGGELISVWRRNGMVYSTGNRTSFESPIGRGEQPWITSNSKGAYLTWITKRDGDLQVLNLSGAEPKTIAGNARDPVIVSCNVPEAKVYVFWEQRFGDQIAIMACQID